MAGFDLVGVGLVAAAIIYSFIKKKDKVGLALIIVLLLLLYMLGYFSR